MDIRNTGQKLLLALLVAASAALGGCAALQPSPKQRVVIQVSDDNVKNWTTSFNVVNNLVATYGKDNVEIELVAFGDGINALTFDSKTGSRIAGAVEQGAKVLACENSMKRFKLSRSDMAIGVAYVPAGVKEIIDRQQQGWVVIRP